MLWWRRRGNRVLPSGPPCCIRMTTFEISRLDILTQWHERCAFGMLRGTLKVPVLGDSWYSNRFVAYLEYVPSVVPRAKRGFLVKHTVPNVAPLVFRGSQSSNRLCGSLEESS